MMFVSVRQGTIDRGKLLRGLIMFGGHLVSDLLVCVENLPGISIIGRL